MTDLQDDLRKVMALAEKCDAAESVWVDAPNGSGKSRAAHTKFEDARAEAAEAAYQWCRTYGPTLARQDGAVDSVIGEMRAHISCLSVDPDATDSSVGQALQIYADKLVAALSPEGDLSAARGKG